VITPALVGEQLKFYASIERLLAEGIAERTGTDAECDLYPRLAAGAVVSAARVAFDYWLDCDSTSPFVSVLRRALWQVAEGLLPPNGTDRSASDITGGNRAQLRRAHDE
jgi:MftR C-terminal domain